MSYENRKQVIMREAVFGGDRLLSVISVNPADRKELKTDLQDAFASGADAVELRMTKYRQIREIPQALFEEPAVMERRTPLILCLNQTGVDKKDPDYLKNSVAEDCINKGLIDAIDLCSDANDDILRAIFSEARQHDVRVILSDYNYLGISSPEDVTARAQEVAGKGADLIKLMYLADNDVDLIRAAQAAKRIREEALVGVPFCISTLGDCGLMYRVLADRCGNDFTYSVLRSGAEGMLLETYEQYNAFRELFRRD